MAEEKLLTIQKELSMRLRIRRSVPFAQRLVILTCHNVDVDVSIPNFLPSAGATDTEIDVHFALVGRCMLAERAKQLATKQGLVGIGIEALVALLEDGSTFRHSASPVFAVEVGNVFRVPLFPYIRIFPKDSKPRRLGTVLTHTSITEGTLLACTLS